MPIRLIVDRDNITRITDGRANDISDGGLLVFAGIELSTSDNVFVEFTPPYSGKIPRSDEYGGGKPHGLDLAGAAGSVFGSRYLVFLPPAAVCSSDVPITRCPDPQ